MSDKNSVDTTIGIYETIVFLLFNLIYLMIGFILWHVLWVSRHGVEIPNLGYGVYRVPTKGVTKDCVIKALKTGYRHIDTAQAYGNEEEVGQGVKESGLKREEVLSQQKYGSVILVSKRLMILSWHH